MRRARHRFALCSTSLSDIVPFLAHASQKQQLPARDECKQHMGVLCIALLCSYSTTQFAAGNPSSCLLKPTTVLCSKKRFTPIPSPELCASFCPQLQLGALVGLSLSCPAAALLPAPPQP